ncbi:UDP-2,3-diacylglucosamine diphosphatase [Aliikangiella coralliicola]|uniref:UDP-2,3-diacylglucosamine diphosphatase n=1 Tax=Aliikangiella coralliicola TaxID=2592383 RepID=A0A545UFF2_9GAMM|nr:UDP-2,3-diacylglucosamine diphosphatase [Aliikangiella coralliicola]TQV88199.1 UDP-2,3-diacylglucosamine diphosphatase [Aliikangiella coralliicola]
MTNKSVQFVRNCQSIWISDIHLGHKESNAEALLSFLKTVNPQNLFLLGDIVDFWEFKSGMRWPQSHTQLFKYLLKLAKRGCKIFYIPGNHDANLRKFIGYRYKNIRIYKEYVYTTEAGQKLLLLHGDRFDNLVRLNKFYGWLGDVSYDFLLFLNRWYNRVREHFGYPYWSLSGYLKENVKQAKAAINSYAHAATCEAKRRGCDGVICGHIHHPDIQTINGIQYFNDGDWIENNTALIEDANGKIELIRFQNTQPSTIETFTQSAKDQRKSA